MTRSGSGHMRDYRGGWGGKACWTGKVEGTGGLRAGRPFIWVLMSLRNQMGVGIERKLKLSKDRMVIR